MKPILTKEQIISKVKVDKNDCWIWLPKSRTFGYGQYGFGGKNYRAHRLSFHAFIGQIPEGLFVCHKCNVRDCVNPDHLFLGTPKENMQDSAKKGTLMKGDRHTSAKLTTKKAVEIINRHRSGRISCKELAKEYGVCHSTILRVVQGVNWVCPETKEALNKKRKKPELNCECGRYKKFSQKYCDLCGPETCR